MTIVSQLSAKSATCCFAPFTDRLGSLLIPLSTNLKPDTSEGIEPNDSCFKVAKSLDSGKNIKWIVANPLVHLDKINNEFDVVVSNLPWGVMPSTNKTDWICVLTHEKSEKLRYSFELQLKSTQTTQKPWIY